MNGNLSVVVAAAALLDSPAIFDAIDVLLLLVLDQSSERMFPSS